MSKTDRLLDLTRRIVHAERELAYLRAEFSRLCGDDPPKPPTPRSREYLSIATRVHAALEAHLPASVKADAIAIEVAAPIESVRAALSKLCAAGRVRRTAVGSYRAERSPASPTT